MEPEYQHDDQVWVSSSEVFPEENPVEASLVGPYVFLRVAGQEPLRITKNEWANFIHGVQERKYELHRLYFGIME